MRCSSVKALLSLVLTLAVSAPVGCWAAARQVSLHKACISSSVKTAPLIAHARHHGRRRFLALRQAKTPAYVAAAPSSQRFVAVLRALSPGRRSCSFVPPPEHPPAA